MFLYLHLYDESYEIYHLKIIFAAHMYIVSCALLCNNRGDPLF